MRWKMCLSVLIVCLLFSISIPLAIAPPSHPCEPWPECKGGSEEPPADPAIVFYKSSSGNNDDRLIVMNDDGSNQAVVYEDYFSANRISWSPDGGSIAWSGYMRIPNVPWFYGVWRIDVDIVDGSPQGSNLQLLAGESDVGYCRAAAWSPLGDEIAVAGRPLGEGGLPNRIYSIPASGGSPEIIYTSPEGTIGINYLSWNSDGTKIAFAEIEMSTGDEYIKVIDWSTGTATHTLVKGLFNIEWLDWARQDSNTLAFNDGAGMIYTLDIDSGSYSPAVNGVTFSWSPDNAMLVYQQPGKKRKINTYEFSTGDITSLVNGGMKPDWRRF